MLVQTLCRFLLLIIFAFIGLCKSYKWQEKYFNDMPIDHFTISGVNDTNTTFDLRYLINDTWWDQKNGPIYFCPGSEGGIDEFADHTGIMWDWAKEFKALLVFVEHRYYGKSLPFGKQSNEMPYLKFLTVDQALADFAVFLQWFKLNIGVEKPVPVIAFGGSYGGMLAAWMRARYPHLVDGAISSSAPIRQLIGGDAPCWTQADWATHVYATTAPGCDKAIKKSWDIITNKSQSETGKSSLRNIFKLCKDQPVLPGLLKRKLYSAWLYSAMYNYPYPANVVQSLPAWPVKQICNHLTAAADNDDTFLRNVFKAASIYFNHDGKKKCMSLQSEGSDPFWEMWAFQTCTEIINPQCSNESHIFVPDTWDQDEYFGKCEMAFGTKPKIGWLTMNYGLQRMRQASKIIFSNCQLDPWYNAGIKEEHLKGSDPSLIAIDVPNAAHHYELRSNHPNDTSDVIKARNRMKVLVQNWIRESSN